MASFFIFFYFYLYKLVSERPFSYLSDSWFPPPKTPSVLCKATEGLWQTRNGKSVLVQSCGETWHLSPFSAFTRELWKWTQFPVPPVWRNCAVCVSVLLAWLARCSVLTVGSVVAGVSAFSRASAKKLSASFPSRLCGLSGSWFACDCLRYFLNAYSSCVCGFNHTIKTSLGLPVGNLHGNWSSPASICTAVTLVLLLQTCKQVVGRAACRYI